ncbi:S1C family serine protease [Oceanobacillus oncorhynchi]|uniref:S1C family serine protease n=1 Tax=Oceanobacillus oncorhynchi TaxID=545501 RepID=UPI0025A397AC|nr:trypsin-like peptidase domain-containing protein [Oceanobacillus oncorhynchi]MDM8100152.1 trypsin-like peptidase domain-containing protein [Oceanobacillus oncorhynchi]
MSNNDYENERNENVSGDLEKNNEPLTDEASTIDNNRSEQNRTTDEKQQTYVASSETNPPKQKKSKGWFRGFFSGAIGGIISSVLVVLLLGNQLLPASEGIMDSSGGETASSSASSESIIPTIASDDADVSADISEVSQAVVGVINMQQQNLWEDSQEAGTGSGIIYKKEDGKAYVITNNHVVEGAEQLQVALNEEHQVDATVLGTDALTDLAVLEIDGEHVDTVANLGSSEDIEVGETVMAIGNPLGMDFNNSVTRGIISGLNRNVEVDTNGDGAPDWVTEVLQTDAAINPGNSGGALVNADGDVIGINSMKIAQSQVEGIGFAIPIDEALPVVEKLETDGEVSRPLIGISTAPLTQVPPQYQQEIELPEDVEGGMVIANVQSGSPADNANLQQFDVITKINGNPVTSIIELRKELFDQGQAGEHVEIEFARDGELHSITLKMDELKANQPEANQ